MFEFAASGGVLSQKRLHQKRSLFWNCLVIAGGKFKHLKFLENVKFEETNNIDSILGILCNSVMTIIKFYSEGNPIDILHKNNAVYVSLENFLVLLNKINC